MRREKTFGENVPRESAIDYQRKAFRPRTADSEAALMKFSRIDNQQFARGDEVNAATPIYLDGTAEAKYHTVLAVRMRQTVVLITQISKVVKPDGIIGSDPYAAGG